MNKVNKYIQEGCAHNLIRNGACFVCGKKFSDKKNKHGGKRKGSGRPKLKDSEKKEPTKVMRIPQSKVEQVAKIIKP